MNIRRSVRRPHFSRRRFLRGAGGATLALPALNLFKEQAHAQGTGVPKRLVIMFTPNGTLREEWVTGGGESNFVLGPILEPLEDLRDRLLVLRGLEYYSATRGGASGHAAISSMLTGRPSMQLSGEGFTGGAISIDQYIAQQIGKTSTFKSLPLGIRTPNRIDNDSRMSYSASGEPISPENNPAVVYDRLSNFISPTGGADADPQADRLLAKRRSAYSAVREELSAFESYIAADDRQKLEQHLAQVDELEAKVGLFGSKSCDLHPSLRADEDNLNGDLPQIAAAQTELALHALECDLTRVVTLQYSKPAGQIIYTWLGMERDHHLISHDVIESREAHNQIVQHDRWHAEQLGTLLRGLAAREAEDGSPLLDHTAVLWMTELGDGDLHSNTDISMLLAGNLGGYFDSGRSLELEGRSNNDLYATLLQGYGIDESTFGEPSYNEGLLSQLTA